MVRGMGWPERGRGWRRGGEDTPGGESRPGGTRPRPVQGVPELRVVSGDVYPDWEAVYRDNVDRVYRLMFVKVGNRADAEDLTAEVFLAALRPLRVSATVPEVRAYMTTTARTVLAGYWRRTLGREITTISESVATFVAEIGVPADEGESAEGTLSADDAVSGSAGRAARILAELPEQYRNILRLRFLEGYSVREAAAALGVTAGNAKVLQHRALRRAAQLVEGEPQ
jgi:RNA polymerase sigma-70 factor, ECF subfamily